MKKLLISIIMMFFALFCYPQDKGNDNIISTTVEFVVNTDNFVHNDNYTYFIEDIVPFIEDNFDEIDKILLVGSASPEGNYKRNLQLADIRAKKIYSCISDYIPKRKVVINNDYDLFLQKTNLDADDYSKLRATYIEISLKERANPVMMIDTVYIKTEIVKKDTVIIGNKFEDKHLFLSVYNDLTGDLLKRKNIGVEVYYKKVSFFIEGSFSSGQMFGKTYNIDFWHTGLRQYFNNDCNRLFIEEFASIGYFDTDLFTDNGKYGIFFGFGLGIGYKFDIGKHWKLYPIVRFGYNKFFFNDYYVYDENGNIIITFDKYVDGKQYAQEQKISVPTAENLNNLTVTDKSINKDFYKNCYFGRYVGPSFVGIVIQRDFYIKNKNKRYEKF